MKPFAEVVIGDTIHFSWISSGDTPSQISHGILDSAETVVTSTAVTSGGVGELVNSGDGHFLAQASVESAGLYVSEWIAWVSSYQYINREHFRAYSEET